MDLFDHYFTYVKNTEPPIIYHRWSLISAVAAYLGRQCWLPFGPGRIFPNMYTMLVGNPGTRKSTAIKSAKKIITAAGYSSFSAERTTKEKFLLDLQGDDSHGADSAEVITNLFGAGPDDQVARETFICADEFNEFVGSGNFEFLSMLGALWDWDEPDSTYKQRVKNSKSVEIYQPTINILGGNTHASLVEAFPLSMLGQGFMSRLIFVYSEPSGRKITIPTVPSADVLEAIIAELVAIKQTVLGPISISKEAFHALDIIYKTWTELEDHRFKHYSTRRFTHLLKLCMIFCAVGKRTELNLKDVLFSNTLLTYVELSMPKALGELGRKKSSDAASTLMGILYETRRPLKVVELWKFIEKDLDHMSDLTRILANLQAADKIQVVKIPGTSESGFLPKQKTVSTKSMYVDLSLLKGKEIP